MVTASETSSAPPDTPPALPKPPARFGWIRSGATVAIVTWLIGSPAAVALVRHLDDAGLNPVSVRGAVVPLIGLATVMIIAVLLLWRFIPRQDAADRAAVGGPSAVDTVTGLVAGLYASWFVLLGRVALVGTPNPLDGLHGDALRVVTAAMRYSTTWRSADTYIEGLPAEYPPLFPWLVGRFSALTGESPITVMATAQLLVVSFSVIAAYLLWRRLVPSTVALLIAAVSLTGFLTPSKPYEVISLVVLVPWAVSTFWRPAGRGRLHWLVSGALGGLMLLTYPGFLVYAGLGILAMIWLTWRAEANRWGYLGYLALVALVALIVCSWYVVPYLLATAKGSSAVSSDLWQSVGFINSPLVLPFTVFNLLSVLQLFGLAGLVWLRATAWWARPLAVLLLGHFVFFLLAAVRFVLTGHTMFAHYTVRTVALILITSAVLTGAEAVRRCAPRVDPAALSGTVLVLTAVLLTLLSLPYWKQWMPTTVPNRPSPRVWSEHTRGPAVTFGDRAHLETLPDGTLPRLAPADAASTGLPADQIIGRVREQWGPDARPVLLTADERIFAYAPWFAFTHPEQSVVSALWQGPERLTEVRALIAARDPAAFARLVDSSMFAPISVFLLKNEGAKGLRWGNGMYFQPEQFGAGHFDVTRLPNGYVLAIRKR